MKLSKNLVTQDDDGNVWRLINTNLIVGGIVLTTQWDFVSDEDLPPSDTIADEEMVECDGRHWHEVVYYFSMHDDYPGGPYTHGMRCIVYELAHAM